jgi:putative aldouronate transport system substrate-binding protein
VAGPGYIDSTGNSLGRTQKDFVIENYNYIEKETLKAYGIETWTDLFPQPEELGVSKHGRVWQYPLDEKNTAIINKADELVKTSLIDMIIGPQDTFDESWEKMCQNLRKMGVEEVGTVMTELIKTKKELWSLP